ncbi:MAG: hypothetical protein QM537_00600 [Candidatus Symbiobacter sp.]|nr:hypothetical protein [Candidatus Symbiobacter sp.]
MSNNLNDLQPLINFLKQEEAHYSESGSELAEKAETIPLEATTQNGYEELRRDQIHQADMKLRNELFDNEKQNRELRKSYAEKIYWLVSVYLLFIAHLLWVTLYQPKGDRLSDSVLIALLTTTTATVLGLFVIVANYFFNHANLGKEKKQ